MRRSIWIIATWGCLAWGSEGITQEHVVFSPPTEVKVKQGVVRPEAFDTVELPFYDDFSTVDSGLSPARWAPSPTVRLNSTMSADPPSYGMVTFDGLNASGKPYQPGYRGNAAFPTDTLTSLPINLAGLRNADSVIFSFFVNSGGVGDPPEAGDSLVLQFLADSAWTGTRWVRHRWVNVWVSRGHSAPQWQYVAIPILSDTLLRFFAPDFRFRWIRYANPGGNFDLWHIDYVYLNKERRSGQIDWVDVSAVNAYPSVLKDYTAMPWHHFIRRPSEFLAPSLFLDIHNLSDGPRNVTFQVSMYDAASGKEIFASPAYALNVAAGPYRFSFSNGFNYVAVSSDSPGVRLVYRAQTFPDIFRSNDSLVFNQPFGDFFAYDDGTAEAGYGLINTSYGKVAMRFYLPEADTLRAVAIAFNESEVQSAQSPSFRLGVWRKIGPGSADQLIYQSPVYYPKQAPRIGNFYYYPIDTVLVVAGEIYVGWIQTDDVFLNVGLDMNFPQRHPSAASFPFLHYYAQGQWRPTRLAAVPLIRLVRGNPLRPVASAKGPSQRPAIRLFPNPAFRRLHLEGSAEEPIVSVTLHAPNGKVVKRWHGRAPRATLSLEGLRKGVYIARVQTTHQTHYQPILKIDAETGR